MLRIQGLSIVLLCLGLTSSASAAGPPDAGKLRIIAFGAHPDDAEFKVGGTAARWAAAGHHVKLVSVTNGDIGHWQMAGGPLALRQTSAATRGSEVVASIRRKPSTSRIVGMYTACVAAQAALPILLALTSVRRPRR